LGYPGYGWQVDGRGSPDDRVQAIFGSQASNAG
jgi:hypothetical protein